MLAASLAKTATIVSSMPMRLASFENIGTVIIILKFASGAIVERELLLGVMYGSAGATVTLLANTVLKGYAEVDQAELASAAAIVLRRVVIAAVI